MSVYKIKEMVTAIIDCAGYVVSNGYHADEVCQICDPQGKPVLTIKEVSKQCHFVTSLSGKNIEVPTISGYTIVDRNGYNAQFIAVTNEYFYAAFPMAIKHFLAVDARKLKKAS